MSDEIPNFSNLTTKTVLTGDKVRIDDLLNKQIVVCNYHVSTSKFKDKSNEFCVKVQFYNTEDGSKTKKVFFSGSGVLKEQLDEVKVVLEKNGQPFLFKATVKKCGNYYSFE